MDSKRKPPGYWEDFSNLERELLAFIEEHGTPGVMPTQRQLQKTARSNLGNAIQKHGGYQSIAECLGLELAYTKKRHGYWDNFANVQHEILAFMGEKGTPGVMPIHEELKKAELSSLGAVIQNHGGYPAVAAKLGLKLAYSRKQTDYWDDFATVESELLSFIEKNGTPGVMPTYEQLKNARLSSLGSAIQKHGGSPAVAEQLGLELVDARKPLNYWKEFSNLEHELLIFIEENGIPGEMPTYKQLQQARRSDLTSAIPKHGGWQSVAERLELTYAKRRTGYWDEFANLERELLAFIEKHGTSSVMPTREEFKKAGRSDLNNALHRYGGSHSVAQQLGLELASTAKPPDYWKDFANVERELLVFIKEQGTPGVMPTQKELLKAALSSLTVAIQKHGGCSVVAHRLDLNYTSPEHITPRTASDVEKTARAIQPLAEANLLSGAQVMVILRRAGLLEYRNRRVVRLSGSLARGKHEEIETAIAQLASCSEELTTETVTFKEGENFTAAEAEALVSSGLEANENSPLAKSTSSYATKADIQRERVVIRGLSALGELRLPLDSDEQTEAQKWRTKIAHLRALSAAKADELFADPEYTRQFLVHLKNSRIVKLSHQWLRGKLSLLLRPDDVLHSAVRILRGGGHLFIVEPDSTFTPEGLARFVNGLRQFGFEPVGSVKELRTEDGALLKAVHFTLTGEMGKPEETLFEKK